MSSIRVNQITDTNGGNSAVLNGVVSAPGSMGFRNRILNGDCRIDQRNNGASVNANAGGAPYALDRFNINVGGSSAVIACQQVSDAPAGFSNSLRLTISTAATLSAAQFTFVRQIIEGYNIADLGWGTASAQAVTVSFWVKASITGAYSLFAINSAEDRSFVGTFSVNAANTWEYKTVAIPGDTSGTWLTNNSNGIRFGFDLGSGSNFQGTANAWNTGWKQRTSSTVNFIGTSGATWQITGVQLEAGTVATPFERVDFGTQLMRCQRYFQRMGGSGGGYERFGIGINATATNGYPLVNLVTVMRATPTLSTSALSGFALWNGLSLLAATSIGIDMATPQNVSLNVAVASGLNVAAAIGLIANNSTFATLSFSAEL